MVELMEKSLLLGLVLILVLAFFCAMLSLKCEKKRALC